MNFRKKILQQPARSAKDFCFSENGRALDTNDLKAKLLSLIILSTVQLETNPSMNENEWMKEWMNEWLHVCMSKLVNETVFECLRKLFCLKLFMPFVSQFLLVFDHFLHPILMK